jgi:hypothetical protein
MQAEAAAGTGQHVEPSAMINIHSTTEIALARARPLPGGLNGHGVRYHGTRYVCSRAAFVHWWKGLGAACAVASEAPAGSWIPAALGHIGRVNSICW